MAAKGLLELELVCSLVVVVAPLVWRSSGLINWLPLGAYSHPDGAR